MSPPDLTALLGEARDLIRRYQSGRSGRTDAFQAFADLTNLILHQTVVDPSGLVRLTYGPRRDEPVVGGAAGPNDPVPLTDGRYLRLTTQLFFENTPHGRRANVKMASFQYQLDREGEQDAVRSTDEPSPSPMVAQEAQASDLRRFLVRRGPHPYCPARAGDLVRTIADSLAICIAGVTC